MRKPVIWLDYLHNQWRGIEGMFKGYKIVIEEISHYETLVETEFDDNAESDLRKIVKPELESFLRDVAEDPAEMYTCL